MFGSTSRGVNAYAKVGLETGIVAASPHRLIEMLFDGAIISVISAMQHMRESNIAAKGQAISKAITIIDGGLRASLDKKVGGEIAVNLDSLYEYMSNRLLMANIKNQPEILEEIKNLLIDLKGAWCAIDKGKNIVTQPDAPAIQNAYDPLAPNISTLVKA